MMRSVSMCAVVVWVLFLGSLRKMGTRSAQVTSRLFRKIFLPAQEPMFLMPVRMPSNRAGRLQYLAWLSRRQLRLARRFGTFSKDLEEKGQNQAARKVAMGAFLHWKMARKVDRKFYSETKRGLVTAA